MTNYVTAYDGTPGWQRDEAHRLATTLRQEAIIQDGIIRWNSNNSVPPEDCVALAAHIGLPIDVAECDAARSSDFSDFLAIYRDAQANRSPEEIAENQAEARAAHGPGVILVNILTGAKYTT